MTIQIIINSLSNIIFQLRIRIIPCSPQPGLTAIFDYKTNGSISNSVVNCLNKIMHPFTKHSRPLISPLVYCIVAPVMHYTSSQNLKPHSEKHALPSHVIRVDLQHVKEFSNSTAVGMINKDCSS